MKHMAAGVAMGGFSWPCRAAHQIISLLEMGTKRICPDMDVAEPASPTFSWLRASPDPPTNAYMSTPVTLIPGDGIGPEVTAAARRVIEAHGGALWSGAAERSRAACALRLPLRA